MLEMKLLREKLDFVKDRLKARPDYHSLEGLIDTILGVDEKKRHKLAEVESLRHISKSLSKEIGRLKQQGKDIKDKMKGSRELSDKIKSLDSEVASLNAELKKHLLNVPNLPHPTVPAGESAESNTFIRAWGEKKDFAFKPRPHWEIGERLGIFAQKAASKIAGSGFTLYTGDGALLERALINFMLDIHVQEQGYTEVFPPFIVKRDCMVGTGQLPKLEEDMYLIEKEDLFLIPTAEVPVTNIHRDEILRGEDIPLYYTAYTPCFRREAGSYGKDTRGIIRIHQFDKVEMVKFVSPESSYDELEGLLSDAEEVMKRLGLHYRVMLLSAGDMSFAASKCYDIEVWAPGQETYLEVSSCSNFEDFQARRAGIRFRDESGKIRYVHTLNASGVALARTVVALLESYQMEDGSVAIPESLRPYMRNKERLTQKEYVVK